MAEPQKEKPARRKLRDWVRIIPARKTDYFLLTFLTVDLLLFLLHQSYQDLIGPSASFYFRAFDLFLILVWLTDIFIRAMSQENKFEYFKTHWYEILGLIPLQPFRYLLALRALKIAIAYFRLLRSDRDVSSLVAEEVTFRFRDILVDTIADAVFLRSLERVEDVMSRLNYVDLARDSFQKHSDDMREAVRSSINSKSIIGELSKIPLMGGFATKLSDDVSIIIMEILETEVTGHIVKDMIAGVLEEMNERVQLLDMERLTGRKLPTEPTEPAGEKTSPPTTDGS